MINKSPVKFEGIIKSSEIGKGGTYIEFPYDTEEIFGKKGRIKVVCYFEGIEYRGSLVKMGTDCHIIGIKKEIREKINKNIGDKVHVEIFEDTEEREIEIPDILKTQLEKNPDLLKKYTLLSFTKKKEISDLLNRAKKEETKITRLNKILQEIS